MAIEMAPKPSPAASAKSTESKSGHKSVEKSNTAEDGGGNSFLSALASAEEGGATGGPDPVLSSSEEPVFDSLRLTDETLFRDRTLDPVPLTEPALRVFQASSVTMGEATAAGGRNRVGGEQSRDSALVPSTARGTAPSKSVSLLQGTSGQAVLAATEVAMLSMAEEGAGSVSAAAFVAGRGTNPERVQQLVLEQMTIAFKPPEVSTMSMGVSRERSQEFQLSPRAPGNEQSTLTLAPPQGVGGAMGFDGVVAGASTAGADGTYAEQVSYWVGPDVQKAEMSLDGLGVNPVEVSISMQGKEATVVFRSDEALTRDALSSASSQLEDAMRRQGVVLSGVSVGTSNSGDSQRQGSGGRPHGWKQGAVETKVEPAPSSPRSLGSGRSIDLFV